MTVRGAWQLLLKAPCNSVAEWHSDPARLRGGRARVPLATLPCFLTVDPPKRPLHVPKKVGVTTMSNSRPTRTTNTFRTRGFRLMLAATAAILFAGIAPAQTNPSNGRRGPDLGVCQRLQVEEGNKVAFHVYAEGVQIYRWDGTSWTFIAPEAVLFADSRQNGLVGIHYAGPTWESKSGSKVIGMVLDRCTADPEAIQWFLLRAVSSEGPGVLHGVTFIQRVNTLGGLAPSDPGDFVGETARVPYTAEYFFYRKH